MPSPLPFEARRPPERPDVDAAAFIAREYRPRDNTDPGRCTAGEAALFLQAAARAGSNGARAPGLAAGRRLPIVLACVSATTATLALAALMALTASGAFARTAMPDRGCTLKGTDRASTGSPAPDTGSGQARVRTSPAAS